MSEIDVASTMRGIGSGEHEFASDCEGVLVSAFEHERTRVGHERGIEAGGNVAIDRNAGETGQTINQFGGGHHRGIDPVDVGEIAAARVMVNVDEKTVFETIE